MPTKAVNRPEVNISNSHPRSPWQNKVDGNKNFVTFHNRNQSNHTMGSERKKVAFLVTHCASLNSLHFNEKLPLGLMLKLSRICEAKSLISKKCSARPCWSFTEIDPSMRNTTSALPLLQISNTAKTLWNIVIEVTWSEVNLLWNKLLNSSVKVKLTVGVILREVLGLILAVWIILTVSGSFNLLHRVYQITEPLNFEYVLLQIM